MAVEPQAARAMASFTRDGTHGTFTTEERICSLTSAISSSKRYTREATLKFGLYMHKVYIKFCIKSMAGAGVMARSTFGVYRASLTAERSFSPAWPKESRTQEGPILRVYKYGPNGPV